MSVKKKKFKIQCNIPEEFNNFTVDATDLKSLSQISIPHVKHHRSAYLHAINVFIENNVDSENFIKITNKNVDMFSSSQISKMYDIYKKLLDYTMISRDYLSKKHKMLLWIIRCRLNLIIHYHTSLHSMIDQHSIIVNHLKEHELIISTKNVYDYSLAELWRALMVLISKINWLYYHEHLKYYIDYLFFCCGKFFFITSDRNNLFNNLLFYKNIDDHRYSINEAFIEETERIFYGIQKRIYTYSMFSQNQILSVSLSSSTNSSNYIPLKIFYKWLSDFSGGAFLEFIEKDLKIQIYEWHLYIGEKERYIKEEKFGDPTGYNIIAKWRPEHIDQCLEQLKQSHIVKKILKRIKSSKTKMEIETETETTTVDIDLQGLCIIIIDYIMDSILPSGNRFSKRFILKRDQQSLSAINSNNKFPLIVQCFNEFGVYYKKKLYQYENFPICFIHWIKIACEDTTINGVFPEEHKSINLLFLYEKFFPEKQDTLQNIKRNLGIVEQNFFPVLPFHYETETETIDIF